MSICENISEKETIASGYDLPSSSEIKRIFLAERVITKKLYEKLSGKYPYIFARKTDTRMLEYLALGTFYDQKTKRLILSRNILAAIEDREEELAERHYCAKNFLEHFQTIFPKFSFSDFYKDTPRMVINKGFDEEDLAAIEENFLKKRNKDTEKVLFRTGERYTIKKMYEARKETDELFEKNSLEMNLNDDQKKVINYLEGLDNQVFTKLINRNLEKTLLLKDQIEYDPEKPNSKPTQERILDYIQEYPKPHYFADVNSNTMRISPASDNFLGLKKELRKSLLSGCISADLRSSQFAILAMQLKAKKAQEFVATGKSFWNEMSLFIKNEPICSALDKADMKKTIYSTAFGMTEHGCYGGDGRWHDGLIHILRPRKLEKMLEHPIMREIIEQGKKFREKIRKDGGRKDYYGNFLKVTPTRLPRAIQASIIQSLEFRIINKAFDIAIEKGEKLQFKIITFQHDGFAMIMNDKREREKIRKLINDAISLEASKYDVKTFLEFETIGEE